jgi:hypothetical protein
MKKILLIILTLTLTSCEIEDSYCERCAQNYDANGVFIGETCWQVPCCEIYYPYDCSNGY